MRLETQVKRFKYDAEEAEKLEDELKTDRRRLQREVMSYYLDSGVVLLFANVNTCRRKRMFYPLILLVMELSPFWGF